MSYSAQQIKQIYDEIRVGQETEAIRSYYAQTYGPDVLKLFSDGDLAQRLFADKAAGNLLGTRGLFCCLEHGDGKPIPKRHFGSGQESAAQTGVTLTVANGSGALEFYEYTNKKGQGKTKIEADRAYAIARATRDVICGVYDILEKEALDDLAGYERAEREIAVICSGSICPYVSGSDLKVKLLKYFHIFFPEKVMEFYSWKYLKNVYDLLGMSETESDSRFLKQGRIALYAKTHGMDDGVRFAQAVYRALGRREGEEPENDAAEEPVEESAEETGMTDIEKNLILYGPPGTGKTYNTVRYAVGIIEGKKEDELDSLGDYKAVKARFDELRKKGRIEFVTFHQSYGYEDFIQGIKPDTQDGQIIYRVEDGVFKKFCDNARSIIQRESNNYGFNKNPTVWKISLDGAGRKGNKIHKECLDTNCIRIGWDEYGEDISGETEFKNNGREILTRFIDELEIGDIVLSCWSQTQIDAIGVVTGEYEWLSEEKYPDTYLRRSRAVRWLRKWEGREKQDILEMSGGKKLMQGTLYRMAISVEDVVSLLDEKAVSSEKIEYDYSEPRVFIIDEINRGNISKIFGELITLIEPDKRLGEEEETVCRLPYGDEKPFGVPKNVWLLGTMNTADRSLVQLDAALRRRFAFHEMMPEPECIDFTVGQVHVKQLLQAINKRICKYLDREHQIGHSYFIKLRGKQFSDLQRVFRLKILPLLQEYFFEDIAQIGSVLSDKFLEYTGEGDERRVINLRAKVSEADYIALYEKSDEDAEGI